MTQKYLAQINIAQLKHPLEAPETADFTNNIARINELAEGQDGYMGRFIEEDGGVLSKKLFGEDVIVNMSIWRDFDSLYAFTYKSLHADFMVRRKEWFNKMDGPYQALWWTKDDAVPTLNDGKSRLDSLADNGPTPYSFTIKKRFNP